MGATAWAYLLLGTLLDIIYVLDGWRSATTEPTNLSLSPKVRGLIYLLGGGVFPVVQSLLAPPGSGAADPIAVYVIAFTVTTLICLLLLVLYADLVSYRTIRKIFPDQGRLDTLAECLPYAFTALQQGIPKFNSDIIALRIEQVVSQRDVSIDFLGESYASLITNFSQRRGDTQAFIVFAEACTKAFLTNLLEKSNVLKYYRASIYFHDATAPEESRFRFLTGASPVNARHSKKPLPADNSLAAWAHRNHPYPQRFSSGSTGSSVPFAERASGRRYNSVIACGIASTLQNNPDMVLSIDSVHPDIPELSDYVGEMIIALSSLLFHARHSMNITTDNLRTYINERSSELTAS